VDIINYLGSIPVSVVGYNFQDIIKYNWDETNQEYYAHFVLSRGVFNKDEVVELFSFASIDEDRPIELFGFINYHGSALDYRSEFNGLFATMKDDAALGCCAYTAWSGIHWSSFLELGPLSQDMSQSNMTYHWDIIIVFRKT